MSTTGYRRLCSIRIRTRIAFRNKCGQSRREFRKRLEWWKEGLERIWDKAGEGWKIGDCVVHFTFAVREHVGTWPSGWHRVTVKESPFLSWCQIGPGSCKSEWNEYASQEVAAHEVGHMMGLPVNCDALGPPGWCDEYTVDDDGNYDENLHPQDPPPQCIMAMTTGDVAALPEHVEQILELLDLSCPSPCRFRFPWWHWERPTPREAPERPLPMEAHSVREVLDAIEPRLPITLGQAAHELARRGEEIVDELVGETDGATPLEQIAVAAALQTVGLEDEGAVDVLEGMIRSESLALRLHAAYALVVRGNADARALIEEAQHIPEPIAGHPPMTAATLAEAMLASLREHGVGEGE